MPPAPPRRTLVSRLRGRTPAHLARLAIARLHDRMDAGQLSFPLLERDIADSNRLPPFRPRAQVPGIRPRIGWVVHPPAAGSGGHTTLFRMIAYAAAAGYDNTVLLYNRHNGDPAYYAAVIRQAWPWLDVPIAELPEEVEGFDALVASSWSTAHAVARRAREGRRLYFVQDYEPFFTPRGSEYAYAEDSYRLGFRNLALGEMVQGLLRDELGVGSDLVPFGLDTSTYRLENDGERRGIAWYARRGNDRRGHRHALGALELFHERHPDEPIHVYGDVVSGTAFPVVNHGSLRPDELNALYNSVVAGLALSFTNVSLVPEEMLAAGATPVVNDDRYARMVLRGPGVVWAEATPAALADALDDAVERDDRAARARAAAASVTGRSWDAAGAAVVTALGEETGAGRRRTETRGARDVLG